MKKLVSVLIIMILCMSSVVSFAAEDMDYLKSFKKAAVRLAPVESPEAVLVVSQFDSGKLIDINFINIPNPTEVYTSSEIIMRDGIDYTFCVYDNMKCENLLFNHLTINTQKPNQLFLAEYQGIKFQRNE